MRKIWFSLSTSLMSLFSWRALARSVPKGFSMMTRTQLFEPLGGQAISCLPRRWMMSAKNSGATAR